MSSYRDAIFPLVDSLGLVPATGDETLGKGGTLTAMSDMLLGRAELVIADVSTGYGRVRRELRAASQRLPDNRVALVTDEDTLSEEATASSVAVFVRPATWTTRTQAVSQAPPEPSA